MTSWKFLLISSTDGVTIFFWKSPFFCIDPLEIHVFSSIFGVPPWNSSEFYSTPWNFPLISSTRGLQIFFSGKAHFCKLFFLVNHVSLLQKVFILSYLTLSNYYDFQQCFTQFSFFVVEISISFLIFFLSKSVIEVFRLFFDSSLFPFYFDIFILYFYIYRFRW